MSNTSSCTIGLRYLLRGISRKVAVNHVIAYCPELIQYPEQAVLSPVLYMFYNKSRIVSFYDKQNFGDRLSKLTADVVCLRGTFMCNSVLTTLNEDSCWNYEEFLSAAFPFFPIPYLFCQIATGRQKNISQRLVFFSLQLNCSEF